MAVQRMKTRVIFTRIKKSYSNEIIYFIRPLCCIIFIKIIIGVYQYLIKCNRLLKAKLRALLIKCMIITFIDSIRDF